MHPDISRGIAAERTRDMQAQAARGRLARQARAAARVTRRSFHLTRPSARPAGFPAPPVTPIPAQRDRVAAQVAERPLDGQEHRERAA